MLLRFSKMRGLGGIGFEAWPNSSDAHASLAADRYLPSVVAIAEFVSSSSPRRSPRLSQAGQGAYLNHVGYFMSIFSKELVKRGSLFGNTSEIYRSVW
jgi:hypothetical protein